MNRKWAWRALITAAVLSLIASACGIPLDDGPQVIATDDLPAALQPGSTTTTTTLPSVLTEDVTIYLVDPGDGEPILEPVIRQIPLVEDGTEIERLVLEQLIAGPTSEEQLELNLSTSVVSTSDQPITVLGLRRPVENQLVVVLSETPALEGRAGIVAFGQIVFTMTELPSIETVRFLIRNAEGLDEDLSVNTDTEEGDVRRPVGRADYSTLFPA